MRVTKRQIAGVFQEIRVHSTYKRRGGGLIEAFGVCFGQRGAKSRVESFEESISLVILLSIVNGITGNIGLEPGDWNPAVPRRPLKSSMSSSDCRLRLPLEAFLSRDSKVSSRPSSALMLVSPLVGSSIETVDVVCCASIRSSIAPEPLVKTI
jgi:hypothetical protein